MHTTTSERLQRHADQRHSSSGEPGTGKVDPTCETCRKIAAAEVPLFPPRGNQPIFMATRPDVRRLVRNGDAYWENHCKTARLTSWVLEFRGASLRINRAMMDRFVQEIPTAVAAVNGWAGFIEGTRGIPQVRTVEA